MDNRLERERFDAALHLLDRQVIDVDGMHVCKVDDLELSFRPGAAPAITRVLTGPAALVPRLSSRSGHWLRARWISLGVQYADRDVPLSFPLDTITHLGSAVELSAHRDGLLDRQPRPPSGTTLKRMGELIGMKVLSDHDELRGKVLDVRVDPRGDGLVLTHVVVGPGRPGSLLGYDRGDFNGPWLVNLVVQWLHRHIRIVPWDAVEDIDWDDAVLRVRPDAAVVHIAEDRGRRRRRA
ncbi:PRC-barrel domain-containing protein [Marmoricola sp. RAF53]|uniref:PRC-barrel domain-containing protein n=1 Tax=Marmoricola sp. RAF53 TaxID=3233059 RepID=UPI003F97F793